MQKKHKNSTSIISDSSTFDFWWDLTMKKFICVMLSLQSTCLLDIQIDVTFF